jgi:tetratricopeptide (TPR) repeat protein
MHKLVHAWSQDRLSAEQRQAAVSAALELLSSMIQECQGRLSIELRLVPHATANFTAFSSIHQQASSVSLEDQATLVAVAGLTHRLGRWDDEYRVQALLRQARTSTLGEQHPSTLTSMNNLALVLSEQGQYSEAEALHRQTLELYKRVLDEQHHSTLISINNLVSVLRAQGKHEEADRVAGR